MGFRQIIIVLLVLFGALSVLRRASTQESTAELEKGLRKFAQVYSIVEENFAEPPDAEKLIYRGAIPGMLRALDPYSVFFDPDQFHQLRQQQEARVEGFGTIVSVLPGRVVVLEAFVGGPAARSGIQPGDEIVEVNGHRIDRLEIQELVELLSETKKAVAQIRLMRLGAASLMTVTVTPAAIAQPSVSRVFFLRPDIGYVKLNSFEDTSAEELRQALEKLRAGGMRALVLDLRDNHGGLLDAAVAIAGFFLKPETVVLSARGRAAKERQFKVEATARPSDLPLAVLVNRSTASASEILAGALQDHHRAVVLGEQTFGKGVVQGIYPLRNETGLALATAQYFTPSGRSIQRPYPGLRFARAASGPGGITPDRVVAAAGVTDWQAYVESRNLFLDFARLYVAEHRDIGEKFEPDKEVLERFKAYLRRQNVPFNEGVWSTNIPFIRNRLKADIFNLALGVAKGDEAAAATDPQIQAAVQALEK